MGRHADILMQFQPHCIVPHHGADYHAFLFSPATSFEEGREEEAPEPGQGGGGNDVVTPFSIRWTAEWKTMQDIHTAEKVAGPLTKFFWLVAGVSGGIGLAYLPGILARRIGGSKVEDAAEEPAAPKAMPKVKAAAVPS
mmetsp:Transcript_15274/g.34712  ORF Transcript_15274/g.34712 Transcript_15274/m.34712 type:complete len:139 (+) Transcript_15274:27-443(+)